MRALYPWRSTRARSCSRLMGKGSCITFHATCSEQGGVVNEPDYSQRYVKPLTVLTNGEKSTDFRGKSMCVASSLVGGTPVQIMSSTVGGSLHFSVATAVDK